MAGWEVGVAAALVQVQALAAALPMPPCVYGCSSPDQCLYALAVAFLRAVLGTPC